MGTLVKRLLASYLGGASQLYHATVMPCYDKKLEAARDELTLPGGVAEVREGGGGGVYKGEGSRQFAIHRVPHM